MLNYSVAELRINIFTYTVFVSTQCPQTRVRIKLQPVDFLVQIFWTEPVQWLMEMIEKLKTSKESWTYII